MYARGNGPLNSQSRNVCERLDHLRLIRPLKWNLDSQRTNVESFP